MCQRELIRKKNVRHLQMFYDLENAFKWSLSENIAPKSQPSRVEGVKVKIQIKHSLEIRTKCLSNAHTQTEMGKMNSNRKRIWLALEE